MHDVIAIANFFIKKGIDTQDYVTPMKLQKLLYFSHGWYLATNDRPLLDSSVQAWEFGPVIPRVYECVKHYGNKPITDLIISGFGVPQLDSKKDLDTIVFLELMWNTYSSFNALQLSEITHEPNSPWDDVAKKFNYKLPRNKEIEDDSIKDYFKTQRSNLLGATHA